MDATVNSIVNLPVNPPICAARHTIASIGYYVPRYAWDCKQVKDGTKGECACFREVLPIVQADFQAQGSKIRHIYINLVGSFVTGRDHEDALGGQAGCRNGELPGAPLVSAGLEANRPRLRNDSRQCQYLEPLSTEQPAHHPIR